MAMQGNPGAMMAGGNYMQELAKLFLAAKQQQRGEQSDERNYQARMEQIKLQREQGERQSLLNAERMQMQQSRFDSQMALEKDKFGLARENMKWERDKMKLLLGEQTRQAEAGVTAAVGDRPEGAGVPMRGGVTPLLSTDETALAASKENDPIKRGQVYGDQVHARNMRIARIDSKDPEIMAQAQALSVASEGKVSVERALAIMRDKELAEKEAIMRAHHSGPAQASAEAAQPGVLGAAPAMAGSMFKDQALNTVLGGPMGPVMGDILRRGYEKYSQ